MYGLEFTTMKKLFLNDIGFCGLWLPELGTRQPTIKKLQPTDKPNKATFICQPTTYMTDKKNR